MRWRSLICFGCPVAALWPLPRVFEEGSGFLRLSDSFNIELLCALSNTADLRAAADDLLLRDGHSLLVPDRGASLRDAVTHAPLLKTLCLSLEGDAECIDSSVTYLPIAEEAVKPLEERHEAYKLEIEANGKALISAKTTLGLFRGLQAFSQLVYTLPPHRGRRAEDAAGQMAFGAAEDEVRFLRAPVRIEDSPAFPWRGFHLDTSRNFYDLRTLKKLIRAASMIGLNVFHWHVTDSHAWPLEIPELPELARRGSYEGRVYSQADVDELVTYANARGIDVMLEIDMPGHTGSIGESYPEHIACFHAQPWSSYAAEPGGPGQLRIASSEATKFAQSVLASTLAYSRSHYLSTGGDEINFNCYKDDEATQQALSERSIDIKTALQQFTNETHRTLLEGGKTPVVWEELAIKQNIQLHKDTLVAVWTNSKRVRAALKRGLRVILAPSDYLYLDCGQGGWLGNPSWWWQRDSWCKFVPWHRVYSLDPLKDVPKTQQHLIQGGEVLLWSEQADDTNVEQLLWPRAAAAAEVFWRGGRLGQERNLSEALPRLHDLRYRMVQRGIRAIPLQPHWCALRPGECDAQSAQALNAFW